ncbi:zinc finger, GRF-type [Artemisia annua]|uniref:Zinc finger, GRF-type n=1 Tax=Artemisia annua TaxID=35608 RepID=A0A2U1NEW2_ARTAN|nr:zinc finger, GRF-type [Artemisia annua]
MVLICDCGKQATIKTSWTNRNPGRRFYCCPSCGFIGWTDPPMCCRAVAVIPGLLRARNELEEELEEQLRLMRDKDQQLKKLNKFLTFSWVFFPLSLSCFRLVCRCIDIFLGCFITVFKVIPGLY